jgi:Zn-dependent protease with chaperone function
MYWYATHAVAIFGSEGGVVLRLVLYLAPLFAGTVLIGFMLKPLVSRRAAKNDAIEVDLDAQPQLRALIQEVCKAVGAPMPTAVELDCRVNAGARLRRGLWSLGRQDLALRIGLPLVKGLSTRQLAGVLAHEFGHFSQRAGMAFTYVIRSVNDWFARVVYERDEWDDTIYQRSQAGNGYIMLFFACARGALWITRQVLRLFMQAGHVVSCLQLRQMEFDADYYEVSFAGTESFISTAREMNRLNVGAQIAYGDLQTLWQRQQAVDDISGLVLSRRASLAPDVLKHIDAALVESKTAWSHTHPADRDRIAHAELLARAGVFPADGPATELMNGLGELSRLASSASTTRADSA